MHGGDVAAGSERGVPREERGGVPVRAEPEEDEVERRRGDERVVQARGLFRAQLAGRGERVNGWMKTIALLRKVRHRGEERIDWVFTFALAVYDLVRLRTLLAARAA